MGDFGMQDVYTLHIKRHRGPNRIISPNCEACQKGFIHVNTLQVRQFTQSGKLPGVCKSCNAQFLKICRSQIRNMNHIENHPHECEICGKTFTHAGNYLKHKRLHEAATHANLQTIEIMKAKLETAVSQSAALVQIKVENDKIKTEKKVGNKQQFLKIKQHSVDSEAQNTENDQNVENEVENTGNETHNLEIVVENTENKIYNTKTEDKTGTIETGTQNTECKINNVKTGTQKTEDKTNTFEAGTPKNEDKTNSIETETQKGDDKSNVIETETISTESNPKNMETLTQVIEDEALTQLLSLTDTTAEKISKVIIVSQPKFDPPYTCTTCNKIFKKYSSYVAHCETHKGPLVCPICEKLCNTRALMKSHFARCESRQPVYMCHYCEKGFNTKSSLKTHLETHAITQETHVCKFCKQTFVVAEELEQHLLEHINSHSPSIDIEDDLKKKTSEARLNDPTDIKLNHFCYECGKGFVHLGKLKTHMESHNKTVPFECRTCKKLFVQSYRLVKHIKTCCKLQDLPIYPCNICNKTFNYANSLRRHKLLHRKPRKASS